MKLDPLPSPWRSWIPKEHEKRAVAVIKAVRDAVGPDVDILIDQHRRLAPMHAIPLDKKLAEFDLYWMEEPCIAENAEGSPKSGAGPDLPIVIGEATYLKQGFRPLLRSTRGRYPESRCRVLRRHSRTQRNRRDGRAVMVAMSPHNYNSTTAVGLSSTVHASAGMPNFIITEYFLPFVEFCDKISPNQLKPKNGYIDLPTAPDSASISMKRR